MKILTPKRELYRPIMNVLQRYPSARSFKAPDGMWVISVDGVQIAQGVTRQLSWMKAEEKINSK